MKKSIDRVYDATMEKYLRMCGTPLEQGLNRVENAGFRGFIAAGIVIPTDVEYTVQAIDADSRFLRAGWFLAELW
jgi:hypothetical protein